MSTMKVGTDAILLSAWCDVKNAKSILDIGTGCGIIALLLASRTKANIDAVEPDSLSANEAGANFKKSPFSDYLNIYNEDFNSYLNNSIKKYDLIVSNPPFFSGDLVSENQSRRAARHIDKLNHQKLCEGVSGILSTDGRFCLVLPYEQSQKFEETANNFNLYLVKKQLVLPKPGTVPNRINMEFKLNKVSQIIDEEITIRNDNGQHTMQYKKYVGDYLLKI